MARNRVRVAVAARRDVDSRLLQNSAIHTLYMFAAAAFAAGLIWINS
jgi:hypothetical protein